MRVPIGFALWVKSLVEHHKQRVPDEIIGHQARWRASRTGGEPVRRPFLLRWYVIPKNRFFNVYLHQFIRDDEDRALHDHPFFNMSLLLRGQYIEHTVRSGGVHWRQLFKAGALKFRSPWSAHRVELTSQWVSTPEGLDYLDDRAPNLPKWVEYDQRRSPSWSLFITGPK